MAYQISLLQGRKRQYDSFVTLLVIIINRWGNWDYVMVTTVSITRLFQVAHERCVDVNEYRHQEQYKKGSTGKRCTLKTVVLVNQWRRISVVVGLRWRVHPSTNKE